MSVNLTTPFAIPNITRMLFPNWIFDDDQATWTIPYELRTSQASGSRLVARGTMYIRNGECTRLTRQLTPPAGLNVEDISSFIISTTRSVPTGYTDASAAAHAGGNTPGARRPALEAHLFAAGHIDASLAAALEE